MQNKDFLKSDDDSIKNRTEAATVYGIQQGVGNCPKCGKRTFKPWGGNDLGYNPPLDCSCYKFKCEDCGFNTRSYSKDEKRTKRKSENLSWYWDQDKFTNGKFCEKCGLNRRENPYLTLEVDHIIPVSRGGLSDLENLMGLCSFCHTIKSATERRNSLLENAKGSL